MKHSQKKFFKLGTGMVETFVKVTIVAMGVVFFCSSIVCQTERPEATVTGETEVVSEFDKTEYCAEEPTEEHIAEEVCFLNPVEGVLTSEFGVRSGRRHTGIDIGASAGVDILAAADGTVAFADVLGGYGKYIVLTHKEGYETAYAHCSYIAVKTGESVRRGQAIGKVGSTGNSTGPHLHFEIKNGGEFLNPIEYVIY